MERLHHAVAANGRDTARLIADGAAAAPRQQTLTDSLRADVATLGEELAENCETATLAADLSDAREAHERLAGALTDGMRALAECQADSNCLKGELLGVAERTDRALALNAQVIEAGFEKLSRHLAAFKAALPVQPALEPPPAHEQRDGAVGGTDSRALAD